MAERLHWYPNRGNALQHFRQIEEAGWSKFGNYRVTRGLKLPTAEGDGTKKLEIEDMIEISQSQMAVFRRLRPNKSLSVQLLEQIVLIYQDEMKCQPLDLVARMMSCGPLFRNYWLSEGQLNCLALSLPYFINIRYINLENCGMKDAQAGYILFACRGLKKLTTICMSQNQVGSAFIRNLKEKSLHDRIEDLSLKCMKHSAAFLAVVVDVLSAYKQLKSLDLSGNVLSTEAADYLCDLTTETVALESLNLSGCLQSFQPAKRAFRGLQSNTSLRNLNISCNNLRHLDYEFGSCIGRLVQVHKRLVHLDIQCCKLIQEEIFFICHCLKSNEVLMAVHMGFNNISHAGRMVARTILNARVKYPFRADIQIHEHVTSLEDKNILLILNSFVLSSIPSDTISAVLGGGRVRRPLTGAKDVLAKLESLVQKSAAAEDQKEATIMAETAVNEVDGMKKQIRNQLTTRLDKIVEKCGFAGESVGEPK